MFLVVGKECVITRNYHKEGSDFAYMTVNDGDNHDLQFSVNVHNDGSAILNPPGRVFAFQGWFETRQFTNMVEGKPRTTQSLELVELIEIK